MRVLNYSLGVFHLITYIVAYRVTVLSDKCRDVTAKTGPQMRFDSKFVGLHGSEK